MLTLDAILRTTKQMTSYGEGLRAPTPRDTPKCVCPEEDSGSEEDFWAGYHCPVHGAEVDT